MPTCRSPPGFADGHNGADGARNAQGGWKRHAAAGAQAARISLAAAAAAAAFLPFVFGREEGGTKALACVEDVPLAEMWSQGVFINRRHGLAVVVLVLQC